MENCAEGKQHECEVERIVGFVAEEGVRVTKGIVQDGAICDNRSQSCFDQRPYQTQTHRPHNQRDTQRQQPKCEHAHRVHHFVAMELALIQTQLLPQPLEANARQCG